MKVGVDKGVSLLEGNFPVDHLHPALKHLLHYGKQTGEAGLLDWFSMFVFERNNKKVKHWIKSASPPLQSHSPYPLFFLNSLALFLRLLPLRLRLRPLL